MNFQENLTAYSIQPHGVLAYSAWYENWLAYLPCQVDILHLVKIPFAIVLLLVGHNVYPYVKVCHRVINECINSS